MRWLDLNKEINHRTAEIWNVIFFIALFIIACLEIFIAIYEKFGVQLKSFHPTASAYFASRGDGNCTITVAGAD